MQTRIEQVHYYVHGPKAFGIGHSERTVPMSLDRTIAHETYTLKRKRVAHELHRSGSYAVLWFHDQDGNQVRRELTEV